MHGDEACYMMEAYETNWMGTVGENIDEVEKQVAEFTGLKHNDRLFLPHSYRDCIDSEIV